MFPREFCWQEQAPVTKPTFLQSWQKTEELPSSPRVSPQSRHCERPFPMAFFLMFSSLSTRRLRARGTAESLHCREGSECSEQGKTHWERRKELNLLHLPTSLKAAVTCPHPIRSRESRLKMEDENEPG